MRAFAVNKSGVLALTGRSHSGVMEGIALAPDMAGGVLVGGRRGRQPDDMPAQAWVARFSSEGKLVWRDLMGDALSTLTSLALTPEGIYGAGWLIAGRERAELRLFHWSNEGKRLWEFTAYRTSPSGAFLPVQLQPALEGGVYLLATIENPVSAGDWLLMRIDAQGRQIWQQQFNGVDNGDDRAFVMAVDQEGNLYAAGLTERARSGPHIALLSYSPSGALRWQHESEPIEGEPRSFGILALGIDTHGTLRLLIGRQLSMPPLQLQLRARLYRLNGEPIGTVEYPLLSSPLRPVFGGCFAPDGSLWTPIYPKEMHPAEGHDLLWRTARLQQYDIEGKLQREIPVEIEGVALTAIRATACSGERTLFTAVTGRLPVQRQDMSVPMTRHIWYLLKYTF